MGAPTGPERNSSSVEVRFLPFLPLLPRSPPPFPLSLTLFCLFALVLTLSSSADDQKIRNVLGPAPEHAMGHDFTTEEVLDSNEEFGYDEPTSGSNGDNVSPKASPRRLESNESTKTEWVAMEDPRTGYNYFMNRRTMKIAWSRLEMFHQEMSAEETKETPPTVEAPSPVAYQVRKSMDPGFTTDAWEDPEASKPMPVPMPSLPGIAQSSSTLALSEARSSPMPNRAPPSIPNPAESLKIKTSTPTNNLESRKGSIASPVAVRPAAAADASIPAPPPSDIPPKKPYRASIFMRPLPSPSRESLVAQGYGNSPSMPRPPSNTGVSFPSMGGTTVPAPPPPMNSVTATATSGSRPAPGMNRPKPSGTGASNTTVNTSVISPRLARTGTNDFADIDLKPRSGSQAPTPTTAKAPPPTAAAAKHSNTGEIDDAPGSSSAFRRPTPGGPAASAKKQAHQSAFVGAPQVGAPTSARSNPSLPRAPGVAGPSAINANHQKTSPPSSITTASSTRNLPPKPHVGPGGPPPMPTTPSGGLRPHAGSRPPAYAPPNPAVLVTMNDPRGRSGSRAGRVSFRASISRVAPPTWGEIMAEQELHGGASSAPAHSVASPISGVPSSSSPISPRNPAIGPSIGLPPQRQIPTIPMPPPSMHHNHTATGPSSPPRTSVSNTSPGRTGGIRTSHSAHTLGHSAPNPYASSLPTANGSNSPQTMKMPMGGARKERPALTKAYTSVGPIPQPSSSNGSALRPALSADLKAQINFFQLEGFATRFFKSQKRGLFRRAVPIRERLKWTQGSLKTPLLKLKPDLAKKALNMFKWVQICMGDRELTSTQEERYKLMVEMFDLGLNIAALRDEIYCQLCKQTTLNPNADSNLRGWSMITLFLQYFTPTKDLEHWFMDYCREHEKNSQQEILPYVTYALRVLTRGPSQSGSTLRVPEPDEVELALRNPVQPRLFGVTLEFVLQSQQHHTPAVPEVFARSDFPHVITALTSIITRLNGTTTEGIFRIPGSHMLCTKLRLQLEAGNYGGAGLLDPHVPASVLKWWLRDLEEPVVPANYYNACLEAAKSPEAASQCVRVVDALPLLHKTVVYSIINFVQLLARPENVAHTKMAIGSLAIVFGPNLLRCQATEMMLVFEAQKWEQTFVTTLIKHLPPAASSS